MRKFSWQVLFGVVLIALSTCVYIIHYIIFRDVHHIMIYLIGDIAFVFIQILLVTLVINQLLAERQKRILLEKMNMVIGTFFSEVGTELLRMLARSDRHCATLRQDLAAIQNFSNYEFTNVSKRLGRYECDLRVERTELKILKVFLLARRDFLLRLLENPNILEHDTFTKLLWAVFHLTDELSYRHDIAGLPDTDYKHLIVDAQRAYLLLITEWFNYMKHLKGRYPYLYSLAMRTNPFDPTAKPEVT